MDTAERLLREILPYFSDSLPHDSGDGRLRKRILAYFSSIESKESAAPTVQSELPEEPPEPMTPKLALTKQGLLVATQKIKKLERLLAQREERIKELEQRTTQQWRRAETYWKEMKAVIRERDEAKQRAEAT